MTHFDFKTLLPALLQVEDRVSMAHGLESRVPLLDHALVELAATIPADVKFKDGADEARAASRRSRDDRAATSIAEPHGQDGLPGAAAGVDAPGPRASSCTDVLSSDAGARPRARSTTRKVLDGLERENRFGRKIWGLLSLELWQRAFHDRERDVQANC